MQRIAKTTNSHNPNLNTVIAEAIASLKLEGIVLSEETIADLMLFSQGKLLEEEAIQRALERIKEQAK